MLGALACFLLATSSVVAQTPPNHLPSPVNTGPGFTPPMPVPAPPQGMPPPFPGLLPVAFQAPGGPADLGTQSDELQRYQVQLEPPGAQRLFRLESEGQLQRRMMQEAREQSPPDRIRFPQEPVVSLQKYNAAARNETWPTMSAVVEPRYVCHGKLLFEQRNAERYGWDLGPIHPAVSAGAFVFDWLTMPYHIATAPCRRECSAGLCLPGDPVPLLLYPPELSISGLAAQAATVGVLIAIFP